MGNFFFNTPQQEKLSSKQAKETRCLELCFVIVMRGH